MGTSHTTFTPGESHDVSAIKTTEEKSDHRYRVLIIEDHPYYASGLKWDLEANGPYDVIGVAGSWPAALALARTAEPHLIILDVELPGGSGFDLISPLSRICPDAKIAILTGHSEDQYALTAVRLGANGFFQKDMEPELLRKSLEQVIKGERVIGKPRTLTAVLVEASQLMRNRDREKLGVSEQEISILRLAASGLNNKSIGAHQFWSEITVKRKMQDIYRKLSVKTRAQAVAEAMRLGYL